MAAYSFNGFEMESFIGKFLYLSSHGYESNLQLTYSIGNISVNIQANLENIIPQRKNIQLNIKPSKHAVVEEEKGFVARLLKM